MSQLLASLSVRPLYGQVVVESEGATDLPVPETGAERVVCSSESVLIATRGDHEGDVTIEVRRGLDDDLGDAVFDSELSFATPRLVFGSSLGNQLGSVEVSGSGWLPIKIFAEPPQAPSLVIVLVP
jgi:hypothetical protein